MKKLIALLLSCALLVCLLAACVGDTDPTASTEAAVSTATPSDIATEAAVTTEETEAHEHTHINYKGLETADFTLDDVTAAEGRAPDFTYEMENTPTLYIYNDVTLGDLTFTQVQFSFSDTGNRISCTYTSEEDPSAVAERYAASLTAGFGEPNMSDNLYSWYDGHTANRLTLTVLNETTVQVAFYINEGVGE